MPVKTYPDYGRSETGFPSPDIDLTELAARLGSVNTYRRDGKVIFYDPFEIQSWIFLAGGGAGCKAEITTAQKLRGYSSLLLTPGSSNPFTSEIVKYFPPLPNRRYGVEVAVSPGSALANTGYLFNVFCNKYLNTEATVGGFQIDYIAEQLKYYNSAATWEYLADLPDPNYDIPRWANVKIVLDFNTRNTIRILWGEQTFTINQPMYQFTSVDIGDTMYLNIEARDTNGMQRPVYVSDLIITIDEP